MTRTKLSQILIGIVFVLVVLSLPKILPNEYWIHVFVIIIIVILVAASMRSIFLAGELVLGATGFMMIGAFCAALLTLKAGVNTWVSLLAGGLLSAAIAAVLGYPFFRVKGAYFAILTMMVAQVFQYVLGYWDVLTGGFSGLIGIPPLDSIRILGIINIRFDSYTGFFNADTTFFYLTMIIVSVCVFSPCTCYR